MTHTPVVFACHGEQLVGIVSAPEHASDTAMLMIVGGPQYRVGSHRQYLRLALRAVADGIGVMRFDARGMGDAEGAMRSFVEINDDIAAAIDALQRTLPTVKRVGLWGLCGGASAALLYCKATRDPRVAGLALINPWAHSAITQALTQVKHYYVRRLLQGEFWRKLARGGVGVSAITDLSRVLRLALGSLSRKSVGSAITAITLEQHMAQALSAFSGETLVVLSGDDYTAKEFLEVVRLNPSWQSQLQRPTVNRVDVLEADHTFTTPGSHERLEQATAAWLGRVLLRR